MLSFDSFFSWERYHVLREAHFFRASPQRERGSL